jgi:pentatricopeptide repeat domain-containing protein 1
LWEKALAILQEMMDAGGSAPTTVHYSHVLGLLVRAPHHSVSTPQPQPVQAAAGARREEGARQEREVLLMKQLLAAMKRGGVQLDVYAFNLCIRVYGQAGDWRGALDVLADMSRSRVKEDMFTFNWVLVALAMAPGGGRWKHALILLDRMQEMAVVPNVDTYGAAIACCERAAGGAQLGRVLALFGQMAERGLEPDLSCYNAALRACIGPEGGAAGQWKVAMKLLSDMTRKGVHPNKESLDAAVTACEVSDQPEMAEVLKKAVCKLKAARQESSLQTLFQGW